MGRAEPRALADAGPVEERQVDDLSIGDYLAFEYGAGAAPAGIRMSPAQVEHRKPDLSPEGWVWGRVAEIGRRLWRSFPVVAESQVVWVLCEFGDQSSIITGVPHKGVIMMRRSPL
ncbi:hypothetical protein [Streptosporangium amethystogenes]|uniref:hypothetical protein n=1 Tax=Streptosporangium amethystogenes TaxID=2002 RepID=UPI0004C4AC94|nr:hypothetical protein [Streptosporangium amethystogenes]